MKILFITDNFPPEVNAPATRTYEHCKRWCEMGAEVTVITCAPNFPQGKVYNVYKNRLRQKETMDGINVIRVWSYITANEGFIKRSFDYVSFALSAFGAGLFKKTNVIIATSPQFFTTWTACALSVLKNKPWVFELRDLWPESIRAVGALNGGLIYNMLEKIELFLYRNADLIVPNSPAFKQNLINRGIQEEKIYVIPNGANLEHFKPISKNEKLANNLGLNGKFIVGYLGTHGLAHNLDFILDCATELRNTNIKFLFIGDGAEKKNLLKQAKHLELKNVTFMDPIPKQEVPNYLSIFDVALVPLKKSETFTKVIPSKIFEAAAMHKPILLGVEGQAKEFVEKFGVGLCYEPENKTDFIKKLELLKSNPDLQKKSSNNGQELVNIYDREKLAKQMYELLNNI